MCFSTPGADAVPLLLLGFENFAVRNILLLRPCIFVAVKFCAILMVSLEAVKRPKILWPFSRKVNGSREVLWFLKNQLGCRGCLPSNYKVNCAIKWKTRTSKLVGTNNVICEFNVSHSHLFSWVADWPWPLILYRSQCNSNAVLVLTSEIFRYNTIIRRT